MLVFADGRTVGTIGGGCYENEACLKAREALATGRQALLHFDLNDDFAQENGLVCGGQMDVHVDPLAPAPRLYIIGAGHVGWHLAETGGGHGVPPARRRRSREVRQPRTLSRRRRGHRRADRRMAAPRRDSARRPTRSSSRAAIRTISTRCGRWRRATCKYLGLIGSRAKVARIRTMLLVGGHAARVPRPRARANRARDRRGHAGRDRRSASSPS